MTSQLWCTFSFINYIYLILIFFATLCNPMNHRTPGLPVHHQHPECHPAISSSVVPFSSCPQSLSAIRVFSSESTLRMRWPKYWSFSFSIIPSKEIPGLISFRMDWLDLLVQRVRHNWATKLNWYWFLLWFGYSAAFYSASICGNF